MTRNARKAPVVTATSAGSSSSSSKKLAHGKAGASAKVKAAVRKAANSTAGSDDMDDLNAIFGSIKTSKNQKNTNMSGDDDNNDANPNYNTNNPNAHISTVVGEAGEREGFAPKAGKDGLYHAPQKTMGMSDDEFFTGRSGPSGAPVRRIRTVSEAESQVLKQEGVDRIVSMKQLEGMLSRSSRAGTTANCPFDCDCCF